MYGAGISPGAPKCSSCGRPLTYINQHKAWYCYNCKQYGAVGVPQQVPPRADGPPAAVVPCRECGTALSTDGRCPRCDATSSIMLVEQLMEDLFAQGVNITMVAPVVGTAREHLRKGAYADAKASARAAMDLAENLEDLQAKAGEQVKQASEVIVGARKDGKDTAEAESYMGYAESYLKSGDYEKSLGFSMRARSAAKVAGPRRDGSRPAATGPEPKGSDGTCPSCGEQVEPGWRRCPNCTAPLVRAQPAPEVPQPHAHSHSTSEDHRTRPEQQHAQEPAEGPKPAATDDEFKKMEADHRAVRDKLIALQNKGADVTQALMTLEVSRSFLRTKNLQKASQYCRKAEAMGVDAMERKAAAASAEAEASPTAEAAEGGRQAPAGEGARGDKDAGGAADAKGDKGLPSAPESKEPKTAVPVPDTQTSPAPAGKMDGPVDMSKPSAPDSATAAVKEARPPLTCPKCGIGITHDGKMAEHPRTPQAEEAERELEAAKVELHKLAPPEDEHSMDAHRHELARSFVEVAEVFLGSGRYDKALHHARRALKVLAAPPAGQAPKAGEGPEPPPASPPPAP